MDVVAGRREPEDALRQFRQRLQVDWQQRIARALTEPCSDAARPDGNRTSTPIEEIARVAVAAVWPEVERVLQPVFQMLAEVQPVTDPPNETRWSEARPAVDPEPRQTPWLSAEEAAPVLNVTPHTLRRLAREDRSPVVVRRIGGRWCFSRRDVERFVGETAEPSDHRAT